MAKGVVYFLLAPHSRCVKIGFTSNHPDNRAASLQTGCPEPLYMLGWHECDSSWEKELHDRFADYRVRGEWFAIADETVEFLLPFVGPADRRRLIALPHFDRTAWDYLPGEWRDDDSGVDFLDALEVIS